ncbi:hypothetical protein AAFG13_37635 [Bradyrhizobium sp. B124]
MSTKASCNEIALLKAEIYLRDMEPLADLGGGVRPIFGQGVRLGASA